jgi:hypothetical protein
LRDCSCFFHIGKVAIFFAVQEDGQDATQMLMELAIVRMGSKVPLRGLRPSEAHDSSTESDGAARVGYSCFA